MNPEEKKITEKKLKKKRSLFQKIVNVFLYFFLGLLLIVLIIFAVTQTPFFRDFLRDKVVEIANEELNGTLSIEKIEGTIFTSLSLINVSVNMEKDTLLKAESIEVKTSPLQLLLKNIYVRKIGIKNANISFIKDSLGELNISKLFPPSEESDTTASEFPFTIQVADLKLTNVDFSMRNYDKLDSSISYSSLNLDNFILKNLNLSLNAFADINENDFEVEIKTLSVAPNIKGFSLENLSGTFRANPENLSATDLKLLTNKSDILINASLNNYNVFDTVETSDINESPLTLDLETSSLNFSDLQAFVPSLEILRGSVFTDIEAEGTFNNLKLSLLNIEYEKTRLQAEGTIKKVIEPDIMFIDVDFSEARIIQEDINKLLPSLKLPVYKELGELRFNKLTYKGNPLEFLSDIDLETDKGNLLLTASLNLRKDPMIYDIKFETQNFDISPFAGVITDLNSNGTVKGRGTSPDNLSTNFSFNADGSEVRNISIDSLDLIANADDKKIEFNLQLISDTTAAFLKGNIDFTKSEMPSYVLNGDIQKLNLAVISNDSSALTSLNFTLDAEGESFNPEEMNLFLMTTLHRSSINDIYIDSTRAIVDLRRENGDERIINIISDLADITIAGHFSVPQTISVISKEASFLSSALNEKITNFFPKEINDTTDIEEEIIVKKVNEEKIYLDSLINFQYLVEFKNFDLISLLLKDKRLQVDGELSGNFKSTTDSIILSLNTNINYVKYWGENEAYFLSNFILNTEISNLSEASTTEDIILDLNLSADRIFAGSEINELNLILNLEKDNTLIDFSAKLENYASANISGDINFSNNFLEVKLDSLIAKYNQFTITNKNNIVFRYTNDRTEIESFTLARNNGEISIEGILDRYGTQDLKLSVYNFDANDLMQNLLQMRPENTLLAKVNLNSKITGTFSGPLIDLEMSIDSITYKNRNFGAFNNNFKYENKNLNVDIKFIDSTITTGKPALTINGNVPIDLSLESVEERLIEGRNLDLRLYADDFNLAAFGDALPAVNRLRGSLIADLNLKGTLDNPAPEGLLILRNCGFILEANNLEYFTGLKVNITPELLSVDSLVIENSRGTENGGRMTGHGIAALENLNITSSDFKISGDLKVLGEESRGASPSVYGELIIATNGNVEFTIDEKRTLLRAPIIVRAESELIFSPAKGGYQNTRENFVYKFIDDTKSIAEREMDFETLKEISQKNREENNINSASGSSFDYIVDLTVEEDATIIFVLSQEFNQDLTAVLEGDLLYENEGGRVNTQGELKLLEGSTLEFFKTLEADGTIRFESELSNPYLNIVATYRDYYVPASGEEDEVAVKIKIEGALKELNQRFQQSEDNIAVYYGEDAIENNEPSTQYDKSDAFMFLLTGEFTDRASQEDVDYVRSQAYSLAGSVVGGLLNQQFGDVISSIEVRESVTGTRISVGGRAGKFRYRIGGRTEDLDDVSKTNIRIEYPIIERLLLRLERREASTETYFDSEMINELGLQYRFEF